ncbi:DUF3221 domain-containing protein [Halobacillus trueperi]|uniref:DUF3221 domain-containing protein n=1 Tax=Halobacillus trueperi TaxID=156205 RepID=A0A3E0J5I6_9BACI|nr:DUF3221 domain-containing protein [Halobacillus trueperi]REJ07974.1 DUF3221 domain-containing protein [Halobacillus trueperi]
MLRRTLISGISVLGLLLFFGCSSDEDNVNIEGVTGEIEEIKDDSFLIQGSDIEVDLKYTSDTVFNGKERNEFVIGDKVKTWYASQPLESNPSQATASKIEIIE